jgi:hypothetical protein
VVEIGFWFGRKISETDPTNSFNVRPRSRKPTGPFYEAKGGGWGNKNASIKSIKEDN